MPQQKVVIHKLLACKNQRSLPARVDGVSREAVVLAVADVQPRMSMAAVALGGSLVAGAQQWLGVVRAGTGHFPFLYVFELVFFYLIIPTTGHSFQLSPSIGVPDVLLCLTCREQCYAESSAMFV
eukprot:1157777-Pelagomonas_calceolata.AAC.5